jgi:glutaconate CoA-transferase subunit A
MRHYTENKLARFEEWSHMSIGLRYRAGRHGQSPSCRRGR